MTVDTRHLLNSACCDIPDMEVAASRAEEDARVRGGGMKCCCYQWGALDVQGCKKRVRVRRARVDVVKVERRARTGGEE